MFRPSTLVASTILCSLAYTLASPLALADPEVDTQQLLNLSLEQLSNIEVTSVSKTSEKASEAAAALYVITPDDIRQSGATNIPDLLRQVPGLDVAQSGSDEWAVSSRGFNGEFANKMLVLIDGRSVYTPLFAGVYWDVQDVPLQDIERIEVIRGPGATLWGANAVNGVINIITKSAKDTTGGFISETAGNQINSQTTTRYGMKIGDDAYARVYAKYDSDSAAYNLTGGSAHDAWNKAQGGFRSDWKSGDSQSFTFQGDVYRSGENRLLELPMAPAAPATPFLSPTEINETDSGANLLGRWDNKLSPVSDVTLQMYLDDARRDNIVFDTNIQTLDLDLQHVWTKWSGNEIVWGAGYRLVKSDTSGNSWILFNPPSTTDNILSSFVQDKITLHPNDVFLTLGSKFEHNDFTGFEFQPSARLSWLIDDKQMTWASVSRAVRTPDISDRSVQLVLAALAPQTFLARLGVPGNESERLVAYEWGYRIQPVKTVSLDVSTFYNRYTDLILGAAGPTVFGSSPVLGSYALGTAVPVNTGSAHSYGIETETKWTPKSWIKLAAGYTLLNLKFDQADPYGFSFAGKSPRNQFNIRSTFQLPHDVEFDTSLYYVDSLFAASASSGLSVPSYYRLDSKLSWKPIESIELSLVGQNLLSNRHPEFAGFLYQNDSEIPRSVYGNITWKF